MRNSLRNLKSRIHSAFAWQMSRFLLLTIAIIALIISIFDFDPDLEYWIYEIISNIIIVSCITFSDYILIKLSGIDWNKKTIKNVLAVTVILVFGGLIGGFLGWQINSWFFNVYISSVLQYAILVSGFSLLFGLIAISTSSRQQRLRETTQILAEKEINEQRLLNLKTRAELEALQAKINPHFLFNTLNSISGLIHEDPEKADDVLQKLAHLFRYTLAASRNEFTKLEEEMEVIQEYLDIEKIRLDNRLTYRIDMDDRLRKMMIPGMLLQPLVENSVKHGIAPIKTGGHIEIVCRQLNRNCEIKIMDTGKGFDKSVTGSGFGLHSVKERLELYYGQQYELQISHENGTCIKLVLPGESIKTQYLNLEKDKE